MARHLTATEAGAITGYEMSRPDSTGGHLGNFELLDNGILQYDYIPGGEYRGDSKEYVCYQYDPETGLERHCGITPGCFWTEWM